MEEKKFKLVSAHLPNGDQPEAIKKLYNGLINNVSNQILLGATGTGKTFTMANVIEKYNKQALVLTPNKTLAMQLYLELKGLFPENKVEYFVSNFDFFQPEAYLAARDLYIGKDAKRNNDLEMMRLSTMNSLVSRKDTIVVASVASIYPIQNPDEYSTVNITILLGQKMTIKEMLGFLVRTGYEASEDPMSGCFVHRGDVLNIYPGHTDAVYYRVSFFGNEIDQIATMRPLENTVIEKLHQLVLFPATSYVVNFDKINQVCDNIINEMYERKKFFLDEKDYLKAERIEKRTLYDVETLREFGTCAGVENYSAHLDFRKSGETPYTLFDFFEKDFITFIDESHIMMSQVRGMYNTTRSRLENLVEYGFRLPSALDNRPLTFDEFILKKTKTIYLSATPGDYELELVDKKCVEQIIRPTGLLDPIIEVRNSENQMEDIINEILKVTQKKQKVLITALTIRMAEEISDFISQRGIKVSYLHSELKTIERSEVIFNLRKNVYDVIVGINLLREGLDIPEVSLVCILDADKSGFLRNTRSLIQTVGRAARNSDGRVIFYAYETTRAMQEAIDETTRRRKIQEQYNEVHNIIPKTIIKDHSQVFKNEELEEKIMKLKQIKKKTKEREKEIIKLRKEMLNASNALDFERAAELRDIIIELEAG